MIPRAKGGIAIEVPSPSRRWIVAGAVLLVWCVWSLVALLASQPFQLAMDEAAAAGGWSREQVHMQEGSYRYRFVYSLASARVAADTTEGRIVAEIHLLHVPLYGWSVTSFERLGMADRPRLAD